MKHLAAYLLLRLGGNTSPSASNIKGVLESVGIEVDNERLEKLLSELKGKDINKIIFEGTSQLASVPSGCAVDTPTAGCAAAGITPAEEAEEPKEGGLGDDCCDEHMGLDIFD